MNMALPKSPDAIHLHTSIYSNSLRLVPSDPIRHQVWRGSYTWIDLFIIKSDDRVLTYTKSDAPFIAGHDFIEIAIASSEPPPVTKSLLLRDLKRVSPELLHLALPLHLPSPDTLTPFSPRSFIATSTSSELVLGPCTADSDTAERAITCSLTNALGSVAPLRQFTLSSRRKPWVNPQIRALMRSRDRAYRLARSLGAAADVARFRSLRAQASNALDSAKNIYVTSAAPTSDVKWRDLRRLHVTRPGLSSPLVNFTTDNLKVFYASTVSHHPPITERDFEAIAN